MSLAISGCSDDSGKGAGAGGGAGSGGSAAVGGAGQGGVPSDAGAHCPTNLVGTWSMVSVFCGTNDVTQDIATKGGVTDMRFEVSDTGSSCKLVATQSGPSCSETEEIEMEPGAGSTFDVVSSKGITSCQPAQCTFNANDAPCAIGDRSDQAKSTSMKYDGTTLTVTSEPPAGACQSFGLTTIVTYAKS